MHRWFRSLRLRLQAWHALILLVVVAGFGSVLYREIVRSRWDEVDAELLAAGRVLEGALRALPRPILDSLAQDLGQPRRPPPPPRPPRRDPPHDPPHDSPDHFPDARARDDRGPRDGEARPRPRPGEDHPVPRLFAPGQ